MPVHPSTSETLAAPLGRLGRWSARWSGAIFSSRLSIGLMMAVPGLLIVRPHRMWGAHPVAGTAASAALVLAGLALRFWAGGSAGTHTHSGEIEAPALATGGPYAFVRNPIYLGSMVLGLGMVGVIGDPWLLPLWAAAFAALYVVIIPAEERFLGQQFGDEYAAYRQAVPRLLPRLARWPGNVARPFRWEVVRGEARIVAVLIAICVAMEVAARLRGH